jgi:hypothetical protein
MFPAGVVGNAPRSANHKSNPYRFRCRIGVQIGNRFHGIFYRAHRTFVGQKLRLCVYKAGADHIQYTIDEKGYVSVVKVTNYVAHRYFSYDAHGQLKSSWEYVMRLPTKKKRHKIGQDLQNYWRRAPRLCDVMPLDYFEAILQVCPAE